MIRGVGLDVVAVARLAAALERFGERFLARCFGERELARPADPQHLAGAFAAKEAALKALGTGWAQGIGFRHLYLTRDPLGKPGLELLGPAAARAAALGVRQVHVSITHTRELAAAVVILEG